MDAGLIFTNHAGIHNISWLLKTDHHSFFIKPLVTQQRSISICILGWKAYLLLFHEFQMLRNNVHVYKKHLIEFECFCIPNLVFIFSFFLKFAFAIILNCIWVISPNGVCCSFNKNIKKLGV